MIPLSPKDEIAFLEAQLKNYERYLQECIERNEPFAKTKIILNDMSKISKNLIELKKLDAAE